jgi:hypothetical protein
MSALFEGDRECRYWHDPAIKADLGIWGDDAGNACYYLHSSAGSALMGFDHESPMSPHAFATGPEDFRPWPGVYDAVPDNLFAIIKDNPFGETVTLAEVTFCIWNRGNGLDWNKGKIEYPARDNGDPDGSKYVLGRLRSAFDHFDSEMEEKYNQPFDGDTLFQVFSNEPLTVRELKRIKPDLDLTGTRDALVEIGLSVGE